MARRALPPSLDSPLMPASATHRAARHHHPRPRPSHRESPHVPMCLLPCCAAGAVGAAFAANKVTGKLDEAFGSKPQPTENAFVTELKLLSGVRGDCACRLRVLAGCKERGGRGGGPAGWGPNPCLGGMPAGGGEAAAWPDSRRHVLRAEGRLVIGATRSGLHGRVLAGQAGTAGPHPFPARGINARRRRRPRLPPSRPSSTSANLASTTPSRLRARPACSASLTRTRAGPEGDERHDARRGRRRRRRRGAQS